MQITAKKIEIKAPLGLPSPSQEKSFEVDKVFNIASTPVVNEALVEVAPSEHMCIFRNVTLMSAC